MALFKKKTATVEEPMDLDAVMKKYDRESNTRVWEGTPRLIVNILLAFLHGKDQITYKNNAGHERGQTDLFQPACE